MTQFPDKRDTQHGEPIVQSGPLQLEYEQLSPPEQRRAQAVKLAAIFVAVGWIPFLCGVVTGAASSQSGSAVVIQQHFTGAIFFMALGVLTSSLGAFGMIRLRSTTGAIYAAVVILAELSIAVCAGLAR